MNNNMENNKPIKSVPANQIKLIERQPAIQAGYIEVHLPDDALGKVFCPICAQSITGIRLSNMGWGLKRLIPCTHVLWPEQEELIVQDMLKRGL